MPSFTCKFTTLLTESDTVDPELRGRKPYNVYIAFIRLQASDIPVAIAHSTLNDPYPGGTLARVMGHAHFIDGTLIVLAKILHPVPFAPAFGLPAPDHDTLPHFSFIGFVSSPLAPSDDVRGEISFEVTIERDEVYPPIPLVVICVVNRDAIRVILNEAPAMGASVYVSGPLCGWSRTNKVKVDVHIVDYGYRGAPAAHLIGEEGNPFPRATFRAGLPRFRRVIPGPPSHDVLSFSAVPSRVVDEPAVTGDPRLLQPGAAAAPPNDHGGPAAEDMEVDLASAEPGSISGWQPGDGGPPVRPPFPARDDLDDNDLSVAETLLRMQSSSVGIGDGSRCRAETAPPSASRAVDPALQRMGSSSPVLVVAPPTQDIGDATDRRATPVAAPDTNHLPRIFIKVPPRCAGQA